MKFRAINTATGLVPETDEDYEAKRKLKVGASYEVTVKEFRNPKFHRLYFSLINCAWAFLNEQQQEFFHNNEEAFRKTVEVASGHYELVFSLSRMAWLEVPKSIAFDKLSESDFHDLYERVKDVIYAQFIPDARRDEFEQQLRYY